MTIDKRPKGQVFLPPSKSISHRALIAAALSGGGLIDNLADNQDTEATLHCLGKLGASFLREDNTVTFTAGYQKTGGKRSA
jgi:3-phosphoshikimate 1-carboxyvinyltransferase